MWRAFRILVVVLTIASVGILVAVSQIDVEEITLEMVWAKLAIIELRIKALTDEVEDVADDVEDIADLCEDIYDLLD